MTDTIRVYDEALPDAWCENIIEMFESKSEEHHTLTNRNHCPKFTELCVNRASIQHVHGLVQFVLKIYDKYKKDIGLRYIPPFQSLEEFRVKRYLVGNGDRFDEHVDIQRERTAKRAVSFLFYLNTCEGSTVFTRQKLITKLKALEKVNKNLKIYVKADKSINYGKVMDLMTVINNAGFKKVALVTKLK